MKLKKRTTLLISVSITTALIIIFYSVFWVKSYSLKSPLISDPNVSKPEGQYWVEKKTGIKLVWIPSGCYIQSDRFKNRKKDAQGNEVCINGFYMMIHEVTKDQFRTFAKETKYKSTAERKGWSLLYSSKKKKWIKKNGCYWDNPGFANFNNHPVVHVSFYDAVNMANWLTKTYSSRYIFRLPTEVEWEYCCRAGKKDLEFGIKDICRSANIHDKTSISVNLLSFKGHECDDGFALTAPIQSFKSNYFGLYDMIGNVWEWVLDDYVKNPHLKYKRNNPIIKTLFPRRGMLRGGGWPSTPLGARCDYRLNREKTRTNCDLGFRLVMIPLSK